MNLDTILNQFKKTFELIPEFDTRAKIEPRNFILCLIFCFIQDRGSRTLESIRKAMIAATGVKLSRGTFWERLATKRLFSFLILLVQESMLKTVNMVIPTEKMKNLLLILKVNGIMVLDSSSISLPDMAGGIFPGPRNNVAPAVIKLHNCFELFSGSLKWFDISPGTSHDHNHFPDLNLLKGFLIIFDLGYFDIYLFQAIQNVGGFFLSRIKINTIIQIDKIIAGLPSKYKNKYLFSSRIPKGKNIIEFNGLFIDGLFQFRVIGFWNPVEKKYHWYTTNLDVSAKLIYPLYRIRWAVELLFKTSKSSMRLADISSADPNIIQSLVLASVAVTILTHPLALCLASHNKSKEKNIRIPSLQRAGLIIIHLAVELRLFFMKKTKQSLEDLKHKLKIFSDELFDPNISRESSIQRVYRMAGLID